MHEVAVKWGIFILKVLKSSEKPSSEVSLMGCGVKPRIYCSVTFRVKNVGSNRGKEQKTENEDYIVVRALVKEKQYKTAEEQIFN